MRSQLPPWMYKGQNASVISSLALDNTVLKTGWLHNCRATGRRASNSTLNIHHLWVQSPLRKEHLLKLRITVKIPCRNGESFWRNLEAASLVWSHWPRFFFRVSLLTLLCNAYCKASCPGQGPFDLGFPHCCLSGAYKQEYLRWGTRRFGSSATGICFDFIWNEASLGLDFSGNHVAVRIVIWGWKLTVSSTESSQLGSQRHQGYPSREHSVQHAPRLAAAEWLLLAFRAGPTSTTVIFHS